MREPTAHEAKKNLLDMQNTVISLKNRNTRTEFVHGVSLYVKPRERVGIIGESGCGKSLLCRSIPGLLEPEQWETTGNIVLGSKETIGYIVQDPRSAFDPRMRMEDHFRETAKAQGLNVKQAMDEACRMLTRVGIRDVKRIMKSYNFELSGGQLQRVLTALALMPHPKLLIADEPTTAMDVTVQAELLQMLKELCTEERMGLLIVSHDLQVMETIADRIYVMRAGEFVEEGSTQEILQTPKHPYTRKLLAERLAFLRRNPASILKKPETVLQVTDIRRTYPAYRGKAHVDAVRGIRITVKSGECLGIVGESGCGKSTLMRMLAGLEKPDSGEIRYCGREIRAAMHGAGRHKIQMIFQNSPDAVNPYVTVEKIIGEPLRNFLHLSRNEARVQAGKLLNRVGLPTEFLDKYPQQFSGGELQRICIARALAARPELLLLDEPLSSLDVSAQAHIMELLISLSEEYGITQIFVSHDLKAVYRIADRVCIMKDGMIAEELDGAADWENPSHPYTKKLLDANFSIDFSRLKEYDIQTNNR